MILANIFHKHKHKNKCGYYLAVKNLSKKIAAAKKREDLHRLVSTEIKNTVKAKEAKIQLFK